MRAPRCKPDRDRIAGRDAAMSHPLDQAYLPGVEGGIGWFGCARHDAVGPAAAALAAQAPRAQEPGHEHGARALLRRGRPAAERYQLYHEEKAKGGLALTMFGGSSSVAADSPSSFGQIDISQRPDHPGAAGVRGRASTAHDCALMIQLTHAGRRTRWDTGDWLPTVSASPLREHQHRSFPKEMEIEDIRRIHPPMARPPSGPRRAGWTGSR